MICRIALTIPCLLGGKKTREGGENQMVQGIQLMWWLVGNADHFNSLTAIRVLAGMENSHPIGFLW